MAIPGRATIVFLYMRMMWHTSNYRRIITIKPNPTEPVP
jgi:hypothetical protein